MKNHSIRNVFFPGEINSENIQRKLNSYFEGVKATFRFAGDIDALPTEL